MLCLVCCVLVLRCLQIPKIILNYGSKPSKTTSPVVKPCRVEARWSRLLLRRASRTEALEQKEKQEPKASEQNEKPKVSSGVIRRRLLACCFRSRGLANCFVSLFAFTKFFFPLPLPFSISSRWDEGDAVTVTMPGRMAERADPRWKASSWSFWP